MIKVVEPVSRTRAVWGRTRTFVFLGFAPLLLVACATDVSNQAPPTLFATVSKPAFAELTAKRDLTRSAQLMAFTAVPLGAAPTQQLQDATANLQDAEQHLTDAQNAALDARLTTVLRDCNLVISGLADKAARQESNSFWLSMSGLVFGAVLGPAATAANAMKYRAFIAAASGWAGSTNLASQTLRTTGLAGDATATSRNSIVTSLNAAIAQATNGTFSFDKRFEGIQMAQASCIAYAITVPGAVPALPAAATSPAPGASGAKK